MAASNASSTRVFRLARPGLAAAAQLSVAEQVTVYMAYLRRRGHTEETIRNYGHFLRAFSGWAGGRPPGVLTAAEIEMGFFAEWCDAFAVRNRRSPADTTRRQLFGVVRSFYGWLDRYDLLLDWDGGRARNPMAAIDAPKVRQRVNDYLSDDESNALLAAARSPQERITVKLLRWTGVRNGEAIALLVRDFDPGRAVLQVRKSKTDAGLRAIPVVADLLAELERWFSYVSARQQIWTPTTPLLLTRHGKAMNRGQVLHSVKRVAVRAGIRVDPLGEKSTVTAHCLRRTFATDLLNGGARLEVVSKLLGHRDSRTTATYYAELLGETVRDEMFAALARGRHA